MRCTVPCVAAMILPLPVLSLVIVPERPACASTWLSLTKTSAPGCSSRHHRRPSSTRMTSQAVDLSNGLGTNDSSPPVQLNIPSVSKMDSNPAYDRSRLGRHFRLGSKVFNLYGVLFAAQAWLSALLIFPICAVAGVVSSVFDRRRKRPPTIVALLWGRLVLLAMGVRPKVEGTELLPPPEEPVVFVANHASYLDIPVTNFLPRLCKYLMKAELLWLPIVGWKAVLAGDIFVHRQTSETFRRLLVTTTRSLKAGNSIMTFPGPLCWLIVLAATTGCHLVSGYHICLFSCCTWLPFVCASEGTRSKDGRLGEFKRGPFSMAQRAGVRVIPVTITGVCEAMPPHALVPLTKPQNLKLRVHPPISTDGKSVKEVMAEARQAVSQGLEPWQRPSNLRSPPSAPSETP